MMSEQEAEQFIHDGEVVSWFNISEGQDLCKHYRSMTPLSMVPGPGEYAVVKVDREGSP